MCARLLVFMFCSACILYLGCCVCERKRVCVSVFVYLCVCVLVYLYVFILVDLHTLCTPLCLFIIFVLFIHYSNVH
jgi:hypothetical protein